MSNFDLVRMANQIASFFEAYPKAEAMNGTAKHIHNSWEPQMRDAMKSIVDSGGEGLNPLCAEALRNYYSGPKAPGCRAKVKAGTIAPGGADPSFADGGGDAG